MGCFSIHKILISWIFGAPIRKIYQLNVTPLIHSSDDFREWNHVIISVASYKIKGTVSLINRKDCHSVCQQRTQKSHVTIQRCLDCSCPLLPLSLPAFKKRKKKRQKRHILHGNKGLILFGRQAWVTDEAMGGQLLGEEQGWVGARLYHIGANIELEPIDIQCLQSINALIHFRCLMKSWPFKCQVLKKHFLNFSYTLGINSRSKTWQRAAWGGNQVHPLHRGHVF